MEELSGPEKAMRRAAKKVLSDAVKNNQPIPVWINKKIIWKVPIEELERLNAKDS